MTSPAHSRGRVMLSGRMVVSQSMAEAATSAATNPHHSKVVGWLPKRQAQAANSAAVASSMNG